MVTRLQMHYERWRDGCGSDHCEKASNVVMYRGKVPCDVLLIGEAPGQSEDALGVPFIGPAGKLLDDIVSKALSDLLVTEDQVTIGKHGPGDPMRIAYTNMVCCIPRDEDGKKWHEPDDEQIKCCGPRLVEFVRIAKPKMIVAVGTVARDWLDEKMKNSIKLSRSEALVSWSKSLTRSRVAVVDESDRIPRCDITHPAAILRATWAQRGLLTQRAVVTIRSFAMEHL